MKKLLILLLLLSFGSAHAGGHRVALQGQRMLGMGHAGLSIFKNAETVFFNTAGMSFLDKKFNVSFGVSAIKSQVKFQNPRYNQHAQTNNPLGTPLYLYATYKASDNVSVGFAVYTPFGNSVVWDKDWAGSHIVNDISMKVFYIQPSMSYKINEMFSVGAAFIMALGEVNYDKNVNRYLTNEQGKRTDARLETGMVSAAGYSLSFAAQPTDNFSIGLNYRSSVVLNARYGKAEFNDVPEALSNKLKKTAFSATLPMPAELGIGISFKPLKKLLIAADYNYTYWNIYKELNIDFKNDLPNSVSDKSYKNSNTYRVGMEYEFTDAIAVRAGYYYDESPLTEGHFSPETPSLNSHNYTFGLGYQMKKIAIDFSILYVDGQERTDYTYVTGEGSSSSRFGGTYVSNAIIPGLGITYSIDK